MSYSRILEFTLPSLRLVIVVSMFALVVALISGGFFRAMFSSLGKGLLVLTLLFVLSVPFGVWRGGSFSVLVDEWSRSLMVFPIVGALIVTSEQTGKALRAIGAGVGVLAILALTIGEVVQGRLQMPFGLFGNPNDLGMAMGIGLICTWYVTHSHRQNAVWRLACLVLQILMVLVLLKTGSRGSFIGLVLTIPLLVLQYSPMGRIRLFIAGLALVLATSLLVPSSILRRFVVIFDEARTTGITQEEANLNEEAVSSTESRQYLLWKSVEITAMHPLLGVGIGMFAVAENKNAEALGQRGNWHVTHNTYTQISSETGIPALIVYIVLLVTAWRMLGRLARRNVAGLHPQADDLKTMTSALKMYLLYLIAAGMFGSFGYMPFLPTLLGLIYSLYAAASNEFQLAEAARGNSEPPKPVQPPWAQPSVFPFKKPNNNVWNRRLP